MALLLVVALVVSTSACGDEPVDSCMSASECGVDQVCVPSSCGDSAGTCATRPSACPKNYDPVCGCDGQTYSNACMAQMAGVAVASKGECKRSCDDGSQLTCRRAQPTCAPGEELAIINNCYACVDPQTCRPSVPPRTCDDGSQLTCRLAQPTCAPGEELAIINNCYACVDPRTCLPSVPPKTCGGLSGVRCGAGEFCDFAPSASCGVGNATGTCTVRPLACPRIYDPVCGCDGQTYSNACTANAAGVSVESRGACSTVGQICGTRGASRCALGEFCDWPQSANCGRTDAPGSCQQRPQACLQVYDPVCGCDGQTYSNACTANAAGVSVDFSGPCIRRAL